MSRACIPPHNLTKKKKIKYKAKTVIAQIKLKEKEKAQEELLKNISLSVNESVSEKHNLTIIGEQGDTFNNNNNNNDCKVQGRRN